MRNRRTWLLCVIPVLASCAARPPAPPPTKLTVAAAANLTNVFGEVAQLFTQKTGVEVVFSFANTSVLSQQIDNGAPFDVFAAADTEHVDALVKAGKLTSGSRAIYARGQLALWVPKGRPTRSDGFVGPQDSLHRHRATSLGALRSGGGGSTQGGRSCGIQLQSKSVYANSISEARQLANSGNADAAFTAYSLVLHDSGSVLKVDPRLLWADRTGVRDRNVVAPDAASAAVRLVPSGSRGTGDPCQQRLHLAP